MSGSGRGGKIPELVLRTEFNWVVEEMSKERIRNDQIAEVVCKAIEKAGAPRSVFAPAHQIMREHHRAMEIFDNPLASKDKNRNGVGRYKVNLRRRAEKMAEYLTTALEAEFSHDLNSLIPDSNLRSFMERAHGDLAEIVFLIDRAQDGEKPLQSKAEIRNATGSKLKALAKNEDIHGQKFVGAFDIYVSESHESFGTWFINLKG